MFNRTPTNLTNDDLEEIEVTRVDGIFKNPAGQDIAWHGYKMKTKIGGIWFKWKLDKIYNDTMDEVLEEEK